MSSSYEDAGSSRLQSSPNSSRRSTHTSPVAGGDMGMSGGILFSLSVLLIRGCLSATRHDDICGDYNGRKLYLELGHRGFLSARDVSPDVPALRGSAPPTNLTSTHRQCGLEIVTCPSCVITIVFHSLNLSTCSQDGSCRCDYMWITEPPYEASGDPFCGVVKSPPTGSGDMGQAEWFGAFPRGYRGDNSAVGYRSRTRTVSLSLLFASRHRHAFTLEYSSERNRQFLKGYRPSPSANATTGGILSSPFFPALYPRDLGAEHFIISPDPSARVRLLFSDFQLAASSIVEFYDWNGTRLEVSSGAQFRPPVVLSSGPSLLVRFYANGGTGLGYKATYSFLTGQIAENILKPFTDCGGFVEDIGGAITMMEMVPSGSVRAYDCVWIVRPPKFRAHLKTHLYLRVAQFQDMGGSTELHVRQGTTSETPLLEVLRLPSPSAASPMRHHSSSSRYRRHTFHSDATQQRASRHFGWLQQQPPMTHPNDMGGHLTSEITEPVPLPGTISRDVDSTYRLISNSVELTAEANIPWEAIQPTTGAPSSPQALMASPVTGTPRSPPPRRRRPPPVAARKQVGREHVLPLEVGFYVTLSGTFAHESRLSIVYTAFSYMDCFSGTDFLCKNHRCIPGRLTCDGFDHCGDASDEPPSCHNDGDGGLLDGPGGIGMMGGMGTDNGIDRHWYSHTPNYYFPKMERYPDLKTATLVFIVSSLGLILLIAALIILLYRMGSRARQHRELQSRLQTISDLLGEYDGARIEEISTDDPPDYEAPPTYEDVVKAANGPSGDCTSSSAMGPSNEDDCTISGKERRGESHRRARPRPASMTSASLPHDDSPGSSFQPSDVPGLFPPPPHTNSRSCQTTPIPDSPPPTYETALLRASQSMNIGKANSMLHGSTSAPLFPISQPLGSIPSTSTHMQGFASLPSSAPNSLPFMQTLPELPERHISESMSSEDGHSTFTDATLLEEGGEEESQTIQSPISPVIMVRNRIEGNSDPQEQHPEGENRVMPQKDNADQNLGSTATCGNQNSVTDIQIEEHLEDSTTREERVVGLQKVEVIGKKKADGGECLNAAMVKALTGAANVARAGCSRDAEEGRRLGAKPEDVELGQENDNKETTEDKNMTGSTPIETKEGVIPQVTAEIPKETSDHPDASNIMIPGREELCPNNINTPSEAANLEDEEPKVSEPKDEEDKLGDGEQRTEGRGKIPENEKPSGNDKEEKLDKVENPLTKELEECSVRVREMVRRQESKAGKSSKEDLRGEMTERDEVRSKKEVKEEDGGTNGEGEEANKDEDGGDDRKGAGPLPDEIVGGLVKGHIKLFQGLSVNKDDDEGESRIIRRRIAMRNWKSVDVGCAERAMDEC